LLDTRFAGPSWRGRVTCAPEYFADAQVQSLELSSYGAGLLAGDAISAGLAAGALVSTEADASGADDDVSSDLLQAAAVKNIESRTRMRTLRIAFLLDTSALPVAQKGDVNGARILYEKTNFKRV
jgi:hypothetical protein